VLRHGSKVEQDEVEDGQITHGHELLIVVILQMHNAKLGEDLQESLRSIGKGLCKGNVTCLDVVCFCT
jgi:hypothetical protein